MEKCGCVGLRVNNDSVIKYCPVHEAAPLMLAALTEPLQNTLTAGLDFAADLEQDASILENHGYNVRADALRAKKQAIRAAIAAAKREIE